MSPEDSYQAMVQQVALECQISEAIACDVLYLRSRSRWTQELEEELIRRRKAGEEVNVMEFGCTPETGERIFTDALNILGARRRS